MSPKDIENPIAEIDHIVQFFREESEKPFKERYKGMLRFEEPKKNECIVCKNPIVTKQELDDWMCTRCELSTNEVAKRINPNYKKI